MTNTFYNDFDRLELDDQAQVALQSKLPRNQGLEGMELAATDGLRLIGTETDRSPSAVIGECLDRIRADLTLQAAVMQALRARSPSG